MKVIEKNYANHLGIDDNEYKKKLELISKILSEVLNSSNLIIKVLNSSNLIIKVNKILIGKKMNAPSKNKDQIDKIVEKK